MKLSLSTQSAAPQASAPQLDHLLKQVEDLRRVVGDLQRLNRNLSLENATLRGQGEPTQTSHVQPGAQVGRAQSSSRAAGADALATRLTRQDAMERSGVHDMSQRSKMKSPLVAPALMARRSTDVIAPSAVRDLAASRKREPSLFMGGSVDIGIIPEVLRAQFANSWAAPLMSLSKQALDTIWRVDSTHGEYRQFVRNLAHVTQVPLHWRDRQSSTPPPAHGSKRTGLQAALARAESARMQEHTSTFVTRAEPYAFVSGAAGLALLSLSRGDVDNFARMLGAMPRQLIAEIFAQSRGAHVFDHRSIWPVIDALRGGLDISHEHFLSHKEIVAQVVDDFLNQHLNLLQPPSAQLFLQRTWPIEAGENHALGPLKARYLHVIDALVSRAESQANVYSTLEHLDDKRFAMQSHGLVFALVLNGIDKQIALLAEHLRKAPHDALPHFDVTPDELRYQVRQRLSVIVRRAQEGFFVPGEPRLSKEQMAQLPERLRQARQQLGYGFVKQLEQWRK